VPEGKWKLIKLTKNKKYTLYVFEKLNFEGNYLPEPQQSKQLDDHTWKIQS
jgi:hypothetical protein